MTGNFTVDLSKLKAGVRKKLSEEPARRRKAMFEVAGFCSAEAKKRAPFWQGFLTADITGEAAIDGKTVAALIYVQANGQSASYAVQMHEGEYNLGPNSLAKQARVNVTVGNRFITRAIDENREKIMEIIVKGLMEK